MLQEVGHCDVTRAHRANPTIPQEDSINIILANNLSKSWKSEINYIDNLLNDGDELCKYVNYHEENTQTLATNASLAQEPEYSSSPLTICCSQSPLSD